MERLNFSTHAIDSMTEINGLLPDENKLLKSDISNVIKWLGESVKFMLPHGGRVMEADYDKINPFSIFKLPYKSIAIEFSVDQQPNESKREVPAPKRIALCRQYDNVDDYIKDFYSNLSETEKRLVRKNIKKDSELIVMLPINYILTEHLNGYYWTPNTFHVVIASNVEIESVIIKDKVDGWQMNNIYHHPFSVLGREAYLHGYTDEDKFKDTSDEINALCQLLICLHCSNIQLQVEKAPEKLNKKRMKANKTQFFDYHVLTVKVNQNKKTEKGNSTGRTVSEHLRRGHPRKIATKDEPIWINSTTVNAGKGNLSDKDYRLLY